MSYPVHQFPDVMVAESGHAAAPAPHGESPASAVDAAPGHGGEAPAAEGGHAAAPATYLFPNEPPNAATIIESLINKHMISHAGVRPHPSTSFKIGPVPIAINPLFSILYVILIVWVVRKGLRSINVEKPGRLQNAVEAVLGGLYKFFLEVVGERGKQHIPFLGSLWLFIFFNNLSGIFPFMKAPTSSFKTTIALGLTTFVYVQYHAIKANGIMGYFYHLIGSPTDVVTWILTPLFFFIEVIGELIKPISLSLRLYGNIFGEDKLLSIFLGLGMMIVAGILGTPHPIVGVPLQMIFYPLVLLTSTIQATVFALLASIYIVLLMPHEHEEHGPAEGHGPSPSQPSDSVAAAEQV